jgi:hypothetical protein
VIAQLSAAVEEYLKIAPEHRGRVTAERPLERRVEIRSATWRPWLTAGGHPNRPTSFMGPLPQQPAAFAASVLDDLPLIDQAKGRRDRYVDRKTVKDLAVEARHGGDRERVRLWVAVMMWGSGTSNGRGPWRTAQGLASDQLLRVLNDTASLVCDGDLGAAFEAFRLPGCGPSFFTKWFWAVSLTASPNPSPLILDERVLGALRLVAPDATTARYRGATGYEDYVATVQQAVASLRQQWPHIDAEKVEWLLFDRPDRGKAGHNGGSEPCLTTWLAARPR